MKANIALIGLILFVVVVYCGASRKGAKKASTTGPTVTPVVSVVPTSEWQLVAALNASAVGTQLYLRSIKSDDNFHSCYEYKVTNGTTVKSNPFCYPSLVVVGYKKCSTSALFELLKGHSQITTGASTKENCPFDGHRTLDAYFDTLPRMATKGKLIANGCINPVKMLPMIDILKKPRTFYLVIIRDYADWLWSAYNYWCSPEFERNCTGHHWVIPGVHNRSASAFSKMVEDSVSKKPVAGPWMMLDSCKKANTQYSSFMQSIWDKVGVENTLVLASEDLEAHPGRVWVRIARVTGLNPRHPSVNAFEKVRYNTNGAKGTEAALKVADYSKGVYVASGYELLPNATREALNRCWDADCHFSSRVTGYHYAACSANRSQDAYVSKYLASVTNSSHPHLFAEDFKEISSDKGTKATKL